MMSDHYLSRTNLWTFGLPLAIFVLLPLVCWFVVYVTQTPSGIASDAMFVLFMPVAIWAMIPGFLFRQPLFDPAEIGYSPRGLPGGLLIVAFWVVISLGISLLVHYFRRSRVLKQ